MTDCFNTIIQVARNSCDSAPDYFDCNKNMEKAEILRYPESLLLKIYPETEKSLFSNKDIFLINPYNEIQLIPADDYYGYLLELESDEINNLAPRLGATNVEVFLRKESREKSKSINGGGAGANFKKIIIGGGGNEEKEKEKNVSLMYKQNSSWKKQEPNFEYFAGEEFKKDFPILSKNRKIKNLIKTLKDGSIPESYEIESITAETNTEKLKKIFEVAIFFFFDLSYKASFDFKKETKTKKVWKLIF